MSYNKTIWKSKDIITREKMQKIEDQLEVLSEQGQATENSFSASEATAGQVPVADGNGSWAWTTPSGSSSNVLVINITTQYDEEMVISINAMDKTWQEIHDALASGMYVFTLNVLGESVDQISIQRAYINYKGQYTVEIDGNEYSTDNKDGYPSYSRKPIN